MVCIMAFKNLVSKDLFFMTEIIANPKKGSEKKKTDYHIMYLVYYTLHRHTMKIQPLYKISPGLHFLLVDFTPSFLIGK